MGKGKLKSMWSYIRKHGWVKKTLRDAGGNVCLVGAGEAARWTVRDRVILAGVIIENWPDRVSSWAKKVGGGLPLEPNEARQVCMTFNDSSWTTIDDIEKALEKAHIKAQELVD